MRGLNIESLKSLNSQNRSDLCFFITTLIEDYKVENLISNVLNDSTVLNSVAAMSYIHSNGFFKLVLCESRFYKLRLHFWPGKNENKILSNVHNHRWDFCTYLILGKYEYEDFEISNTGTDLYHRFKYLPRLNKSYHELIPNDVKYLRVKNSGTLKKGERLFRTDDIIHRVTILPNTPTLSLFLSGHDKKDSTDVFKKASDLQSNLKEKSNSLSQEMLKEILTKLASVV